MTNRYRWKCELDQVVDGDTLTAWILLDFDVKIKARLRLEGIDTPEIHTGDHTSAEYKKGIKAKEFVEEQFKQTGPRFWIETAKERPGKYGRYIVNVLLANGHWLDALLLKAGLAKEREGYHDKYAHQG
jgi:micrococcal nuclease